MRIITLIFCYFCATATAQTWDWAKNFNYGQNDIGKSIGVDSMNNIYITGSESYSTGGGGSYYYPMFYKFDSLGTLLIADTLTFSVTKSITDKSGNTYLAGQKITKLDPGGNIVWSLAFPPALFFDNIEFTSSGDIVAVGNTSYPTTGTIVLCDTEGNIIWQRSGDFSHSAGSIRHGVTSDGTGNIYVSAYATVDSATGYDYKIYKFNPAGFLISSTYFPGNLSEIRARGNEIAAIGFDLSLQIGSNTYSSAYPYGRVLYLMKCDTSLAMEWYMIFDNVYTYEDNLAWDANGNIYLGAATTNEFAANGVVYPNPGGNIFVSKVNSSGDIVWILQSTSITSSSGHNINALICKYNGDCFVTGRIAKTKVYGSTTLYGPHSSQYGDMLIAKIGPATATSVQASAAAAGHLEISPNPSTGLITVNYSSTLMLSSVELSLKNVQGQLVLQKTINAQGKQLSTTLDLSKEKPGIYYLEVVSGSQRSVKKIVVN